MNKKYKYPPLIEAVCEFRFTKDTTWDLTTPGLLFEGLSKEFPKKKEMQKKEISISKQDDGNIVQNLNISPVIRLYREGENQFIQIGQNVLSIHILKPYPTWEQFHPIILLAHEALSKTVQNALIERTGLRYINQIDIKGAGGVRLEDYLNFRPFLGSDLPQNMVSFSSKVTLPFAEGRDLCNAIISSDVGRTRSLTLDFDYFLAQPKSIQVNESMTWIENAHAELNSLFEGCITENTRRLFNESQFHGVH